MTIYVLIGGLGLLTGFISGLLGIGGGIIMAPLLLFVPPMIGLDPLPMSVVAGLTIIQGLVASVSGAAAHHRNHAVSVPLATVMGSSIFVAALVGGAGAKFVPNDVLLFIFSILALLASALMLMQPRQEEELQDVEKLLFSRWKAIIAAGSVGILGGLVGQGGSFILIPLMIYFAGIPSRIAIG